MKIRKKKNLDRPAGWGSNVFNAVELLQVPSLKKSEIRQHVHLVGDCGPGKTSRVLSPLIVPLLRSEGHLVVTADGFAPSSSRPIEEFHLLNPSDQRRRKAEPS